MAHEMKKEAAMSLKGIGLSTLTILYIILNLNSLVFLVAGYALKDCHITQNTDALCDGGHFKAFPKDIPSRVRTIDLSVNKISEIRKLDLKNLHNLIRLDLNQNSITKIESGAFTSQNSLVVLILNGNRLGKLLDNMFDGLANLRELRLVHNRIYTVTPIAFKPLTKLKFLDLSRNNLRFAPVVHYILQHVPLLETLYIPQNHISTFYSWELSNKSMELSSLDLSHNEIKNFSLNADIFPNLKRLILEGCGKKSGMVWDVRNNSYLSAVSTLDISSTNSLHGLGEVLETFNSSLKVLRLNEVGKNLKLLINTACKITSLTSLKLKNNKITYIDSEMLNLCTDVTELDFANNKIRVIHDNSFGSIRRMKTLNLNHNSLRSVPRAIRNLATLQELNLSFNNISVLDCDDFANLTGLKILHLHNNSFSALKDCVFKDLVNLWYLGLQIIGISKLNGAFQKSMPNLKALNLYKNQITFIKRGEFQALTSLQNLSLHQNKIKTLKGGCFLGLSNLQNLILDTNELDQLQINPYVFHELKSLKTLNLQNNHIKYKSDNEIKYPPFTNLSQLDTLLFSGQRGKHHFFIPRNILQGLTNLSEFNIRDNQLTSLHPHTFNYTPYLNVLYVSSNEFMDVSPDLFLPIKKLKSLYISRTNLRSLDFLLHANLTELEFLQVRKNAFSVIREVVIQSLPALVYLDMQGNSFTCDCDNAWFLQWVVENNQTQVYDAYNFECNYPPNFKGKSLLEIDVHSCTVDLGFVCYISTCCAVMVFLAVSFSYHFLLWHLVYAYYLLLGFIYNSKHRAKQDHQYDAFVSYNVHDELWVLRELQPKLEEEQGWRLCLHHRDFQPGKPIMENISDAIYGSRKTICVISRHYLESEWCSREIQVASFRLFDEKKDVLILVFLEDIPTPQLSPYYRMRKLLKRQTYLSWPQAVTHPDLFWEKLRQALETQEDPAGDHLLLTVADGRQRQIQ